MDIKLYQVIMHSEPLVGDHWQTDIYAGSSSSLSESTPSSDWNSDSSDQIPKSVSESGNLQSKSLAKQDPTDASFEPPEEIDHQNQDTSPSGIDKLVEMMCHPYQLKPDIEIDPLPELIAIREVVAALLDLGGGLIYTASSTPNNLAPTLSAQVPTLLNQSRTTSLSLLSSFLPILANLKKLRHVAHPNDNPPMQRTRTEEAFAASILALLRNFDVFLTSIELRMLNLPGGHTANDLSNDELDCVISLTRLHHQLDQDGWIELFAALANIAPDSSPAPNVDNQHSSTKVLLDELYRIACHFDSHHNSTAAIERIKVIFLKTCGPVWACVGDWIVHGRLPDSIDIGDLHSTSNADFFIGATTSETSHPVENWWDDHYLLKETAIPEFLYDFRADILEAGKATALSRILGMFDVRIPQWPELDGLVKIAPSLDPPSSPLADPKSTNVLRANLRHLAFSSSGPKPVPQLHPARMDSQTPSFYIYLHSYLDQHLSPLVAENHSHLYTRFSSPLKLSTYLNELNEFFLLGSNTSVHFLKKVFEDADEPPKSSLLSTHPLPNPAKWWDEQVMDENLSKAFEYAPSPIISSCLPKIKILPSIRSEQDPLKSLEFIEISLTVPSPLNYVVDNAHVIRTYNRCFVFLSQLARAGSRLDGMIWVKPTIPFGSFQSAKEFERRAESKEFFRLKNRLAWFVNLFSDYSWNLVILNWKTRFINALHLHHGDLSQTIGQTRRWLARLAGLLFLSEQCESLSGMILQVLQLCTRSHEVWTSFNRQANTMEIISEIKKRYNIDSERRRRKIERRKRRMENEQYTLIEEESRYIDPNDSMISAIGEQEDDGEEEYASQYRSITADTASPGETSLILPPTLLVNQHPIDALKELQVMNTEFEKLVSSIQRAIGMLCRNLGRNISSGHHPSTPNGFGLDGSQDLDALTLLECRLDEWII